MKHVKENLFFGKAEDGSVVIQRRSGEKITDPLLESFTFEPKEWGVVLELTGSKGGDERPRRGRKEREEE